MGRVCDLAKKGPFGHKGVKGEGERVKEDRRRDKQRVPPWVGRILITIPRIVSIVVILLRIGSILVTIPRIVGIVVILLRIGSFLVTGRSPGYIMSETNRVGYSTSRTSVRPGYSQDPIWGGKDKVCPW